jgi:hypothetical protein
MDQTNYRNGILERLKDPRFAIAYFLQAAFVRDTSVLQTAINDLIEVGGYNFVELTKVRANPKACSQPGRWNEYRLGDSSNSTSLPVDYVLLGVLVAPPRVGDRVKIMRLSRNGVGVPGIFESTVVVDVADGGFTTLNSVYRLQKKKFSDGQ